MKSFIAILFMLAALPVLAQTNVLTSTDWVATSGSLCGQSYTGYYRFTKTVLNGWGYATNSRPYRVVATNGVCLVAAGKLGWTTNCCTKDLVIPNFVLDPKFRFSVYYAVKPANCSITIIGLNP